MIETIAFVLTGIGLAASIVYYANILSNANKTRELQLKAQELAAETRQLQLYMDVYKSHVTEENQKTMIEMLRWEWKDYNDFEAKYGVGGWAKYLSYMSQLEGIAFLVINGFLDPNHVYDLQYMSIIGLWEKFLSLIIESREIFSNPQILSKVEYLYGEMKRIQEERGHVKIDMNTGLPSSPRTTKYDT